MNNVIEKKELTARYTGTNVIEAKGLTKRYKGTIAVDHIDLEIPAGRIVGLIGPNGAGKTSALKAILGLATYDGHLRVMGMDPSKDRAALMEEVCFIADVAVLPRWIRVWQLIDLTDEIHPRFSREKCMKYLASTKIKPESRVKQLSKGMVAQLHLAIVMSIDARLLAIRLEFLAGLASPPEDQARRMQYQVDRLAQSMSGAATRQSATEEAVEAEKLWLSMYALPEAEFVSFGVRVKKALSAIAKGN